MIESSFLECLQIMMFLCNSFVITSSVFCFFFFLQRESKIEVRIIHRCALYTGKYSKVKFVELLPLVSCIFERKLHLKYYQAFCTFAAFSLQAQKLNRQPTVTYDMGYREEGIDNKGSGRVVQYSDILRFMIPCDRHHKVSPNP